MSKRRTNYSVGRKHREFPWQHWTRPLNTDRRSSRLRREWVKVAVFVISLVPRSTGGFRSFVYSVNMDSVCIDMYTRVPSLICMCDTIVCRYGYNLCAASSTTANLHRHQKRKMLASPNLPFLHLLYAARVNVTSLA